MNKEHTLGSFLKTMGWAFLALGTCLALSSTILSYGSPKPPTPTRTNGTYFECVYPYMGGGIYLPCTRKQRERDV